jgi:N-formylglutamate amidohydrolase
MRAPFEIFEPTGAETPVVVEVPHAGLDLPAPFLEPLAAPARAIGRDADLYVDALYEDAPAEGAHLIVARASRYVVDVNRAETDVDAEVVDGARSDLRMHHGLVWRTTSDGEHALARKLSRDELEERLELVWRPYHRALAGLVERKVARFGVAVVLAAHSMPSVERPNAERPAQGQGGGDAARPSSREPPPSHSSRTSGPRARADVVPGTRGRKSSAAKFIDAVEAAAVARGWTVRHDDPYAGGYTTQHYGRPTDGVHVVQVELARRLYLDEGTLRPGRDFAGVRAWCRGLVSVLGRLAVA